MKVRLKEIREILEKSIEHAKILKEHYDNVFYGTPPGTNKPIESKTSLFKENVEINEYIEKISGMLEDIGELPDVDDEAQLLVDFNTNTLNFSIDGGDKAELELQTVIELTDSLVEWLKAKHNKLVTASWS